MQRVTLTHTFNSHHSTSKNNNYVKSDKNTNILVDPVLIDRPDRGNVGCQQLGQRNVLVAGTRANQTGLTDRRVADDDALDQLLVGLLIVHHPVDFGRCTSNQPIGQSLVRGR